MDLTDFPLAEYAAEHWMDHARFEDVSSHVQDDLNRLFDPRKHHLSVWVWIRDPYIRSYHQSRPLVAPETTRSTPLHYAASIGLHGVAAFLIDEHLQDINAFDHKMQETPLHAASREGHAVVAQLLLENGANVMAKGEHERTPLHLASECGRVEVARVLLEHGARVNVKDRLTFQPCATGMGRRPLPLNLNPLNSIEIRGQDLIHRRCTPLQLASSGRHSDVARVLLEHGAERSIDPEVNKYFVPDRATISRLNMRATTASYEYTILTTGAYRYIIPTTITGAMIPTSGLTQYSTGYR